MEKWLPCYCHVTKEGEKLRLKQSTVTIDKILERREINPCFYYRIRIREWIRGCLTIRHCPWEHRMEYLYGKRKGNYFD